MLRTRPMTLITSLPMSSSFYIIASQRSVDTFIYKETKESTSGRNSTPRLQRGSSYQKPYFYTFFHCTPYKLGSKIGSFIVLTLSSVDSSTSSYMTPLFSIPKRKVNFLKGTSSIISFR